MTPRRRKTAPSNDRGKVFAISEVFLTPRRRKTAPNNDRGKDSLRVRLRVQVEVYDY